MNALRYAGLAALLLAAALAPAAPVQAAAPAPAGGWVQLGTGLPARPLASGPGATATTGWCNVQGCYWRTDAAHVEWDSAEFSYGYGSTYLGAGNAVIKWTLNGGNLRGNPVRFQVSSYTVGSIFEGFTSNGAPGVSGGGSRLSSPPPQLHGAAPSYTWIYWTPSGYGSYNVGVWDKNQTEYMYWSLSNYPGHWYVYARSVVAHATSAARNNYFFDAVTALPGSPEGSGWTG